MNVIWYSVRRVDAIASLSPTFNFGIPSRRVDAIHSHPHADRIRRVDANAFPPTTPPSNPSRRRERFGAITHIDFEHVCW